MFGQAWRKLSRKYGADVCQSFSLHLGWISSSRTLVCLFLPLPNLAGVHSYDKCQSRSSLPFSLLAVLNRLYLRQIVQMFAPATKKTFRETNFSILNGEEGGKEDRPLIVQFCGNDPHQILTSAKVLEPYCDAVDINLGCPQDIAKKGKYGAFLQDEWDLVHDISEC